MVTALPLPTTLLGALLLVALLLAGCGSGGEAGLSTTTQQVSGTTVLVTLAPPAPSTTEVAEEDPTEAILEAHQGFWDTWLAANDPPDPEHPGLRRYYTGAAYERAVAAIEKNRDDELVIRLPDDARWSQQVLAVLDGGSDGFLVRACAVDDSADYSAATGTPNNDLIAAFLMELQFVNVEEGWKVTETEILEKAEGATSCAD